MSILVSVFCFQYHAHYVILVFGWVGGAMVGISPFSCFVSIDFSVLM